jgi:hypothetical protein
MLAPGMAENDTEIRSITLEELAAIAAALEAGLPREEVLAGAGLSREAWEVAQQRWLSKLAAQASRGELGPSRRYIELVAEQRDLATAKAQQLRKKADGEMPVPPVAHLSPLQGARLDGATPPPAGVLEARPSFQMPRDMPEPVAPAVLPVEQQAPSAAPAQRSTLPTRARPGATMVGVLRPFAAEAALPFARSSAPLETPQASKDMGSTMAATAPSQHVPESWALPFQRPKTESWALPFQQPKPESSNPRVQQPASESWGLPFQRPDHEASSPPYAAPAQPDAPARALGDPEALVQYARICAAVRAYPEHIRQIQDHYGLDAQRWTALHKLWHERFQRDPVLRTRWQALIEQEMPPRQR